MLKNIYKLLALPVILAMISLIVCIETYAAPTVKLMLNPDVQEIYAGSESIAITARASGSKLKFKWELIGAGTFDGDATGSAIFYVPPHGVDSKTKAIVSVKVTNDKGEEATDNATFNIIPQEDAIEGAIPHKGILKISVVDSKGKEQKIDELYVSCAKGEPSIKVKGGKKSISVDIINTCEELSFNCHIRNSKRWLVDIWHHKYRGLPLVEEEYTVIINGVKIPSETAEIHGDYANYILTLQGEN